MNRLRKWIAVSVAALSFILLPASPSPGGEFLGRLAAKHCWYRVYYRCCNGPWQYYGSYNDCHKAEEVVRYLRVEMFVDAFYRAI